MKSLFASVFVLNILAIQSGYLKPYQGPYNNKYGYESHQGYENDQDNIETEDDLASIEQYTDDDDDGNFQSSSTFTENRNVALSFPSVRPTRSPSMPKPLKTNPQDTTTQSPTTKPSPQATPQVQTAQEPTGILSSPEPPHITNQQQTTNAPSQSKPQVPSTQKPTGISSTPEPPQTVTNEPTADPSLQPALPMPSQSPQSIVHQPATNAPPIPTQSLLAGNNECVCTPFFRCYDKETSSNLTGVVNDRTHIPSCQVTQKSCPNPNDICCCNLEPPASSTSSTQAPTKSPSPSEISTSNSSCNCKPRDECVDNEDEIINMKLEKGGCKEPNLVCCRNLVQPVTPISSLETTTLSSKPLSQPPIEYGISQSDNASECICTPFYKCYDDETSTNLTGRVNDRIQATECLDSEVCCHNLSPTSGVIENTADCLGTCKPIKDCPGLSKTLEEAQNKNSDAIQKLRTLVCSYRNGTLDVCCPEKGVEHSIGINSPEN